MNGSGGTNHWLVGYPLCHYSSIAGLCNWSILPILAQAIQTLSPSLSIAIIEEFVGPLMGIQSALGMFDRAPVLLDPGNALTRI